MRIESSTPQINSIRLARVSRTYPKKHCVDVVYLDDGGFSAGVPILTTHASQQHGLSYLPKVSEPDDTHKRWSVRLTGKNDVLCAVALVSGMPAVIGFFFPAGEHMAVEENEFKDKHISGFYRQITAKGDFTAQRPKPKDHFFYLREDVITLNFQPNDYFLKITEDGIVLKVDESRIEITKDKIRIQAGGAKIELVDGKIYLN